MTMNTARLAVIRDALDRAAEGYSTAKQGLDRAKVSFELAKDSLLAVRKKAAEIMTEEELEQWRLAHRSVGYAGLPTSEAVTQGLADFAVDAKASRPHGEDYEPSMTLDDIVRYLENGGFDFSGVPGREVNASLVGLVSSERVKKLDEKRYESIDAEAIRESLQGQIYEERRQA